MPGTLTKANLISVIQTENGYTYNRSSEIVETLLEIIKSAFESGDDVMITGFGKFQVRNKSERKGRNPATDEDMILPVRPGCNFQVFWEFERPDKLRINAMCDFVSLWTIRGGKIALIRIRYPYLARNQMAFKKTDKAAAHEAEWLCCQRYYVENLSFMHPQHIGVSQ